MRKIRLTGRCIAPQAVEVLVLLATLIVCLPGPVVAAGGGEATPAAAVYRKGQTRIMPLGDSITNAPGWRVYLQDLLREGGYTFRMVGGRNDPLLPEGYWSDHGGCSGWQIGSFPRSQEFGGADVDWAGSKPDLVLLMIGTNDMQWGQGKDAPGRLGGLLEKIWADVPNAGILVAQITPFAAGGRINDKPDGALLEDVVREYNAAIPAVVAKYVAQGKNAAFIDQNTGFDPAKGLKDKCHPNDIGYHQMAEKWMEGIRAITVKDQDYPDHTLPPIVRITSNGDALTAVVGKKIALTGTLEDRGGKNQQVTIAWRKICGPGEVTFSAPGELSTTASLSAAGSYCLALTATTGKSEGHSDVRVVINSSAAGDDARPGIAGRSIGICFGTSLQEKEAAGVIPRAHWNSVALRESSPAFLKNLVDDRGDATGATYRFWGNNAWPGSNPNSPDNPDGRLLAGNYLANNPVNNRVLAIPYEKYDLILYFSQLPSNKIEEVEFVHRLQVRDLNTDQAMVGPLYAKNMSTPFQKWVRAATNQTTDQKDKTPEANYVLIPDVRLRNIEIQTGGESWAKKGSAHSSLCGIQIVERLAVNEKK